MARKPRALILSGAGRHADPWHPFTKTSACLAAIVGQAGYAVEVRDDIDAALAALTEEIDLIVVNAGDPWRAPSDSAPAIDASLVRTGAAAFACLIERGIAVLATHAAASALRDVPAYGHLLGGRWVPGTSWHPPIRELAIRPVGDHPIADGLQPCTAFDELYSDLQFHAPAETLVEHADSSTRIPLGWARQAGPSRLVYDALGHDERSYESGGHRDLLRRSVVWLGDLTGTSGDGR